MIYHDSRNERYRRPFGAAAVCTEVTLAAEGGNGTDMALRLHRFTGEDQLLPMERREDGLFAVKLTTPETGCVLWYSFLSGEEETEPCQLTVYEKSHIPDWWTNGIVYQIFPDRFAREAGWTAREPSRRKGTHRFLIRDWDTPVFYPRGEDNAVTSWPFWGGTLRGIREKLPYLESLGVTVLYLNPIFEAASNHRYDTGDYTRVDPLLGTEEDFAALCAAARDRGMHVVLDGVFNHTGADSRYFDKFGNYGTGSAYRRWFRFGEEHPQGYECWWGVPDLPNVEESNPGYREFICGQDGIIRRWLRLGADGWRLDVADELPDEFIREIRAACRAEKTDSLLMGEVWEDASNKVSYGQLREYLLGRELDATMHYPFREIALDFLLGRTGAEEAARRLWDIKENYPPAHQLSAMNLIGSHDRERVLTILGGDRQKLKQLSVLQYGLAGVPCLYYGDEAGMTGGTDPYNRGAYPWGREDGELTEHFQALGRLYRRDGVLRTGEYEPVAFGEDVLGARRWSGGESRLVLVNRGDSPRDCSGVTVPPRGWVLAGCPGDPL